MLLTSKSNSLDKKSDHKRYEDLQKINWKGLDCRLVEKPGCGILIHHYPARMSSPMEVIYYAGIVSKLELP
jgi:hypothetical protein